MNIKEEILKMYPYIEFKNEIFLDDDINKVLRDFSLEDVVFKLCSLESNIAWKLNMYLYYYGTSNIEKSIIKYLVKNNISYFNSDNDDIYKRENLIKEFEKINKAIDYSLDDIKKIMSDNEINNKDKHFNQYNISHLELIIMIQRLYKEKKISMDDIRPFINFIADVLKENIIKKYGVYDSKYEGYINELISYLISGKISLVDYCNAFDYDNNVLELLICAKFGKVRNVNTLSLDVIMALKSNRVNYFVDRLLDRKIESFDRSRITRIVINMCALLGEVNVDNIIKTLNKDDYKLRNLLFSFDDIDLSNVEVIDRKIVYNEDFIKFFMGNKMTDSTSILNLIYDDNTTLGHNLENLYYSFGDLYSRYKQQNTFNKKVFFEEFFRNSKMCFNPDEYELEGDIINSYFYNRKHQSLKPIDFVKGVRDTYREMKHNYKKSIPYVKGEMFGYTYETLKANSPEVFSVGADTGCCFKIGGQSDSFVKYCAKDKNARVLVVKNKDGKVVAMSPMIRNGNLVICNSIESINVNSNVFMEKMFQILESASSQIIDISMNYEGFVNGIQAVLCGNYKNFIEQFDRYKSLDIREITDFARCYPLADVINCNLGMDANGYYYIKSIPGFDFDMARSFDPEFSYKDPRNIPTKLEIDCLGDEEKLAIQKKIDAIAFEAGSIRVSLDNALIVIYSDDWYVVVDNNYEVYSAIVGSDPRAYYTYIEYLEVEREYCSNYINGVIDGKSR